MAKKTVLAVAVFSSVEEQRKRVMEAFNAVSAMKTEEVNVLIARLLETEYGPYFPASNFTTAENQAQLAMVLVLGHGSEKGDCVLSEDGKVQIPVAKITASFKALSNTRSNPLPVVLAQCYGHVFKTNMGLTPTLAVMPMTTPEHPTTLSIGEFRATYPSLGAYNLQGLPRALHTAAKAVGLAVTV